MVTKPPITSDTDSNTDDMFLKQSRELLNNSIENLDDDIKDRLYLARRKAIAAQHNSRQRNRIPNKWRRYLPLTGMALTASIALGIFIQSGLWQSNDINLNVELELVSTLENIELYDDLEFYQWLAEEDLQAG